MIWGPQIPVGFAVYRIPQAIAEGGGERKSPATVFCRSMTSINLVEIEILFGSFITDTKNATAPIRNLVCFT